MVVEKEARKTIVDQREFKVVSIIISDNFASLLPTIHPPWITSHTSF